jgi:hypothetical protein
MMVKNFHEAEIKQAYLVTNHYRFSGPAMVKMKCSRKDDAMYGYAGKPGCIQDHEKNNHPEIFDDSMAKKAASRGPDTYVPCGESAITNTLTLAPIKSDIADIKAEKAVHPELVAADDGLAQNAAPVNVVANPHSVPARRASEPACAGKTTIVTAYYAVKSKHTFEEYKSWMHRFLDITDPMVIFVPHGKVSDFRAMRAHAAKCTLVIGLELNETGIASEYSDDFWKAQLLMDPEGKTHGSYFLFQIWLSKPWFVMQAIERDPFGTDVFSWCDIGELRSDTESEQEKLGGKVLFKHPEIVPKSKLLFWAPNITPQQHYGYFYNKPKQGLAAFTQKLAINPEQSTHGTYFAGSPIIGNKETWPKWFAAFKATYHEMAARGLFIGEDQAVFQATCVHHPDLCAIANDQAVRVPSGDTRAESIIERFHGWFGAVGLMHFGADSGKFLRPLR